jgi:hypothetical protein
VDQRWSDVDLANRTLSVVRQLVERDGRGVCLPKTDAGRRTVALVRGTASLVRRMRRCRVMPNKTFSAGHRPSPVSNTIGTLSSCVRPLGPFSGSRAGGRRGRAGNTRLMRGCVADLHRTVGEQSDAWPAVADRPAPHGVTVCLHIAQCGIGLMTGGEGRGKVSRALDRAERNAHHSWHPESGDPCARAPRRTRRGAVARR